jgi:non-ribosomal peptide synthetase-like protein
MFESMFGGAPLPVGGRLRAPRRGLPSSPRHGLPYSARPRSPHPPALAPRTLGEVFAASVARWPERVALDAPGARLSYRGLDTVAGELAARLRAGGVGPGDRVGVRIPSGTAELYVAILGVLAAGAAYVPIDADDPPARADEMLRDAAACATIGPGLAITELAPPGGRAGEPRPDDDAWIIFTSGSTGAPKGVAVTHRAAAAFVTAERDLFAVTPEDRVLAGLSVAFDASCEEMWLAWSHGAALVPAPRALVRAGAELGPWLRAQGVTVVSTVPTLAAIWDTDGLSGVRLLILGGEACPEELAWSLAAGREVWNTYGPTEATVVTTAIRLAPGRPVTIGAPLPGWTVAVLGDDDRPVTPGQPGELAIGGAGLARYLDGALDADRFGPLQALGWDRAYRTGDIVRETPDGLAFVGRRDDQVKIGGRRIELGEVDAALTAVPGVRAACTVVRESAAGNRLLVGYISGDCDPAAARAALRRRLPAGLVPLVVALDELPASRSGKVDRAALPWPPPATPAASAGGGSPTAAPALTETGRWLADRWQEQLGPVPVDPTSDFFALGGTSLAAAKLASTLRARFPSLAVADIYNHRRLGELTDRLDALVPAPAPPGPQAAGRRLWGGVQLAGIVTLLILAAPQWVLGTLAVDRLYSANAGPQVGWGWLIATWVLVAGAPGRGLIMILARRLLLPSVRPGRYPRNGWLACRLWFIERLSELCRLEAMAGTPWAARYARLCGHRVGAGADLGTLPPASSLVEIGAGATIEADVDLHGWWIDGGELVVGALTVGAGARIGTRALLMPGARIGAGAEIEAGAVIAGEVGPGERWAGVPGLRVGEAGEHWPSDRAPKAGGARRWRLAFAAGLLLDNLLGLIAGAPGIALVLMLAPAHGSAAAAAVRMIVLAPAIAASFVVTYAVLSALAVRVVAPLIRPGWHAAAGPTGWALWFSGLIMAATRDSLFALYSSVYTRPWLRLAGITVGRRAEISTAVGLNRLTTFAPTSFAADDVVLATARVRDGWLYVAPISVGARSFLGNGAVLGAGTTVGEDSLIGLLTTAPRSAADGTSWLGAPPLELPRRRACGDPGRTTDPTRRRFLARAGMELIRILAPATASVVLASLVFLGLDVAAAAGPAAMALVAAPLLLGAGVLAAALTVAAKWLLIGRYRAGEHPLWSFFVWRDEIINSCQEQLAGSWLLNLALGTPLMGVYLRLMGARVGRNVWCETLTITEFDHAQLGDGAVVNRNSVVETHLFQDRLMQIGPARLGAGATLGPSSAMLPDTEVGDHCSVGGRAIVMRGERLPPGSRWHGAPVVAA